MKKCLFLSFLILVSCIAKINKPENNSKIYKPDVVFFDYNGTLYDDKTVMLEGCKKHCKWNAKEDKKMFEKISVNQKVDFIKKTIGQETLNKIYGYMLTQDFKVFDNADLVLKALKKQNIPCYVATKSKEKRVREWLANGKMSQYFNGIYGTNDFGDLQKPNKDFAEKIKEVVGLKNQKCWMIGDSKQDIIMAKNLGCKSVIVDNFDEIKQNYANLIDKNVLFMKYSEILNLVKNKHNH